MQLSSNSAFSSVFTNPITITPTTNNWFRGGAATGPTNSLFSTNNALAVLSITNTLTNYNTNTMWTYPTNIVVSLYFNNVLYQSVTLELQASLGTPYSPITNTSNTTYHMVAQPRGDAGFRGDPRFWQYTNSFVTTSVVSSSMAASTNNTNASLGTSNSQWKISDYSNWSNSPDLTPPDLFFFEQDRGIPQHEGNKTSGFGPSLAGVGWLGEVPITTRSGEVLSWSTPRFWGDGRERVNGTDYPPDWLLMDCFHMAAFPQIPQFTGSTNLVFSSFGKININSLKSFFQIARGSPSQSDTILDSITVDAKTVDYRQGSGSGSAIRYADGYKRQSFLSGVANIIGNRNETNNPYTTHFGFLADLITNTMASIPFRPSSGWWPAPTNSSGTIYTATNTTDRRIEGIVRSLVHKLTTHGNQFTIFSVGQALQPSPTGTVDIPGTTNKANVVGEAYLQAVYERAPLYNDGTNSVSIDGISFPPGAITNSPTGAPPMRQLFLRELR